MFNHVMLGSSDLDRSKAFYDAVLGVLGAGDPVRNERLGVVRYFYSHDGDRLGITQPLNGEPPTVANGSTIGFKCDSPEQVTEIHDAALAHGGTSIEDPPGPRETDMGTVYLSYFTDPDGHKLCGIHRPR